MRRALAHRPLLALAAGLIGGLAWLVNPWAALFALPFLAFRRTFPFAAVGLLVGVLLAPRPAPILPSQTPVRGEATVTSVPRVRSGWIEFMATAVGRTWSARLDGCPDVGLGDRLRVIATARPLRDGTDDYARLQGIEGRLRIARYELVARGPAPARFAETWRRSFAAFCDRWLPPSLASLTQALCLNWDGTLDDPTRDQLRATGTIHIVSASGLHVFVLAGFLMGALSLLPVPRGAQILLLAGLLALYALATGLNAPVVRSALMALVGASAYLVRRDRDPLSALALAAVLYLLFRPRGVFDIGFQLSFVTVAGMVLFGPAEREATASVRSLTVDALRLSAVAFAASAPLVAYHFGTLSLVALPANLLIALAVSAVVVGGLLAHLLSFLWLPLGVGLLQGVGGLGGWILTVLDALGRPSWAQVNLPAMPAWLVALIYVCAALTYRERYVHP
jgi:competence protein ComEC